MHTEYLKDIRGFSRDVCQGDLVRIVHRKDSLEMTGFLCYVSKTMKLGSKLKNGSRYFYEVRLCNEQTLGLRQQQCDPDSYLGFIYSSNRNPDIAGYEVLRRIK